MKIRKNISKLIGLSLFMSNFSIYSGIATYNGEIPNRYQTLEEEYITIDNSTEGEIKSIEILGNTVQDKNNLEDIQSVGDLYVDENGNPILDSQGREQYKIEIVSKGKNLFDGNFIDGFALDFTTGNPYTSESASSKSYSPSYIKVLSDTKYTINADTAWVIQYDKDFKVIKAGQVWNTFLTLSDCDYIRFYIFTEDKDENIQLEEGIVSTEYEPYKEEKITILSPTPLEKVGDVADRIIKKNGVWGAEKNIGTVTFTGNENFGIEVNHIDNTLEGSIYMDNIRMNSTINTSEVKFINSKGIPTTSLHTLRNSNYECISAHSEVKQILVRLVATDAKDYKSKIKDMTVKYPVETSQFIPLPNSQQIKLNTFSNKTYIFSQTENGVDPTLKVTVDRLDRMALDAVDEVEVNPTIENLNTARNLVNHVNESDLKEELQQRLNEITGLNDLHLERKTSTSNVDIYIKSENMLSMTLSTSNITFEDYSGVNDLEQSNAIEISINSSLPYQLNSYLVNEIQNADGSNKIDIDRLNIKDSEDTDYKIFTNISEKLVLKDNCLAGNGLIHFIDLKLKGGDAYPADIYKTVIKFEAEQK